MHESAPIAVLLNRILFDPIAKAIGVHLGAGHHAVPDHIVMILLVALGLIAFSWWLRSRLSVENPSGIQHLVEVAFQAVRSDNWNSGTLYSYREPHRAHSRFPVADQQLQHYGCLCHLRFPLL